MKLFNESKMKLFEATESEILSPAMDAIYTTKGAVPAQIQYLRKAIAEETKSISDYEFLANSGEFTPDEVSIITEIINDEKDHIVKWTRLLNKYIDKDYKDFGNN